MRCNEMQWLQAYSGPSLPPLCALNQACGLQQQETGTANSATHHARPAPGNELLHIVYTELGAQEDRDICRRNALFVVRVPEGVARQPAVRVRAKAKAAVV